jgi:membrane-bound inhibitor of C-type lysozyme
LKLKRLVRAGLAAQMLSACSPSDVSQPQRAVDYHCAHDRLLHVHSGEEHARVDYLGEHYELARRASGIGIQYTSGEATLIIDGDTAVFVSRKNVDLQTCRAAAG